MSKNVYCCGVILQGRRSMELSKSAKRTLSTWSGALQKSNLQVGTNLNWWSTECTPPLPAKMELRNTNWNACAMLVHMLLCPLFFKFPSQTFPSNIYPICSVIPLWCRRHCQYGGDDEYYVHVRETGNLRHENTNTEEHVEQTQDTPCTWFVPSVLCSKENSIFLIQCCPAHLAGRWWTHSEGCWHGRGACQSAACWCYALGSGRSDQPGDSRYVK